MATERQIEANRRNAMKSTGPSSSAGKALVSRNAVKHGLTAAETVLPWENQKDFEELKQAMFHSLSPSGAMENQLVERAVELMWRLRRFTRLESALFQWVTHNVSDDDDGRAPSVTSDSATLENEHSEMVRANFQIGRMVDALLNSGKMDKLTRYESGLQRNLNSTLNALKELKAARARPSIATNSPVAEPGSGEEYRYPPLLPDGRIGPP